MLVAVPGMANAQVSQSGDWLAEATSSESIVLAQADASQVEILLWQAAEQGNTSAEYEAYLEQFPDGVFAGMARARMERLALPAPQPETEPGIVDSLPARDRTQTTDAVGGRSADRLADEEDQQLTLRKAIDADIAANRLTSPLGNNAHEKLQQLEKIDPKDQFVNTRREQIMQRYVGWIERSLGAGRKDRAENYVNSLAKLPGSEQRVNQARKDIANAPDKAVPVEKNKEASTAQSPDGRVAITQFPDNCQKPGFFKRTPAVIRMTNKTKRTRNKVQPTGRLRTLNLNDEKIWVYVELPSLSIRKYNINLFVYDSAGKLQVKSSNSLDSKTNRNTTWTSWVSFTPRSDAPTGTWRFMMCEGGYRHAVETIDAIRR